MLVVITVHANPHCFFLFFSLHLELQTYMDREELELQNTARIGAYGSVGVHLIAILMLCYNPGWTLYVLGVYAFVTFGPWLRTSSSR